MKAEEEKQLWERWKEKGDQDAREALVLHHMQVVRYIAGRIAVHCPPSIDMNDLIGWGVLGLLDALDKYDHRQPIKFSTYAAIRVRGAIIDQIRSLDWAPRSLRAMARKVSAARESLRHLHGREPSADEIAQQLDVDPAQVEKTQAQLQLVQLMSLDTYLSSEDAEEWRRHEIVEDTHIPPPDVSAETQERRDQLVEAILKLPEQQQKVLNLYYYEELTLKEIGVVLNVSESRICQVHGAAVKQLRQVLNGGS